LIALIRQLIRPYRGSLLIILAAMLVETLTSLAAPWPLKVIIDNVVGHHKLSPFSPWPIFASWVLADAGRSAEGCPERPAHHD
jgi:ABC-type bacteriocin/lantibiotic exporter with double-glycine peptidase domain